MSLIVNSEMKKKQKKQIFKNVKKKQTKAKTEILNQKNPENIIKRLTKTKV